MSADDTSNQSNATATLSKTERRRAARQAKKLKLAAQGKAMNRSTPSHAASRKLVLAQKLEKKSVEKQALGLGPNPKGMAKADRKEKYTKKAHDRSKAKARKKAHKDTICFVCRGKGHAAVDCPSGAKGATSICFRCGSEEHRLDACPEGSERTGNLPFASCFICKEKGHLSGDCPNNERGVFINGGCCKLCGSNKHVESRCTVTKGERKRAERDKRALSSMGEAVICQVAEGDGGEDEYFGAAKNIVTRPNKSRKIVF